MCLLCEELWMPFELPPEAKARSFVADSPEPEGPPSQVDQAAPPVIPESSADPGDEPGPAR